MRGYDATGLEGDEEYGREVGRAGRGATEESAMAPTASRPRLTARERHAASITEAQALKNFSDLALLYGGWYAHLDAGEGMKGISAAGQPDVLLILPAFDGTAFTVWYELKIGNDRLSDEQRRVLDMLAEAPGVVSGCVRYGRLREGEIDLDTALERIRRAMKGAMG